MRTKVDKEWTEKEVTLEPITVDQLRAVMQNKSDKLRLINVWATWCGPCRIEYPDLLCCNGCFGHGILNLFP